MELKYVFSPFVNTPKVLLEAEEKPKVAEKETDFFAEHTQEKFTEDFAGMSLGGAQQAKGPIIRPEGKLQLPFLYVIFIIFRPPAKC